MPLFGQVIRFLLIGLVTLAIGLETAKADTPKEAVDRIWKAAFDAQGAYYSSPGIWILSRDIARKQGVDVIAPIMQRSKDWKSMEVLIFTPVVYFLPQEKAIPILKQYQTNGKPWEQQCATVLLFELTEHFNDLKEMEKHIPKE